MDKISQITSNDEFIKLCKSLFVAEYKDFQTIDDSGGDAGNDGYSQSNQILFQMYCPEKPEKADDSVYRSKIKEDLDKAKKLVDGGKYKIKEWIFITPRQLREPVQTYLREEAKKRGLIGIAWAGPKLAELLAKFDYLQSQFPDFVFPNIVKKIDDSTALLADRLDSVDEVKKESQRQVEITYQRRIDQAKEKIDRGEFESAKKEYQLILKDLELETKELDRHIYFRAYNNLGVCELNLGRSAEAAELFEKAYKAEPDLPMAISKLATAKLLQDKAEEGLPIIDSVLEKSPEDENAISTKSNILYALEKYSDLVTFLKSKQKINLLHWYEGRRKTKIGDSEGAIESFKELLQAEPKNVNAMLFIVQNIMTAMQEVVKNNPFPPDKIPPEIKEKFLYAIELLNKAIVILEEKEQKYELDMAYTNLSGCYVAIGEYEKAIQVASKAINGDPSSSIPFINKGVAHLKLGQNEAAIESFNKYKKLGGEDPDVDSHIAQCSLRIGDIDTAEKIIESKLQTESGVDYLSIVGLAIDLYSRRLDNEKLEPLLNKLEKEFPDNSQALRIRALYLQRRGQEGVQDLIKKALKNAKTESEKILVELDLAEFQYDQKNYEEAAKIYEKYFNKNENTQATSRYAECLFNSGQYGVLLEWISSLSSELKEDLFIKELEANANLNLGNLEKASSVFKVLFEKNPSKIQHLIFYGMCRFRLGHSEDTKRAYDAIKNRVNGTKDLIMLASGYELIGDWQSAIDLSFKALEKDPNNPLAHKAYIFTFFRREQAEDANLEEKYIKAFQKSLSEFNSRFPEDKDLQGFESKEGDISGILNVVDQMSEAIDAVTNLYKDSQAPMATIPKLAGRRPFDVWAGFTNMEDVGIKISFGSSGETESEVEIINKAQSIGIVVDLYPLFLLAHVNRLDLLTKVFKKVFIHQAVLDEIIEAIEDRKISARKGLKMLGKINGQHRLDEIPPEQIQKTVELFEKIKEFLISEKGVEIQGLSKEKKIDEENILTTLHPSTQQGVLLAEELELPFYCDDRILRVLLAKENNIPGFSSQSLFITFQNDKLISTEERSELQKTLIELNYHYIPIDSAFLFSQLEKEAYKVSNLDKVVSAVTGKDTNLQSLSMVLSDLFLRLMLEKKTAESLKLQAFTDILKKASCFHDLEKLEEGIFIDLQKKVNPAKHEQLKSVLAKVFKIS